MRMHDGLQRLEGDCEELEDQLSAARHSMEEQDAAINLAMEDKLTAGEEAQQTLEDLAVFAEEVGRIWLQQGASIAASPPFPAQCCKLECVSEFRAEPSDSMLASVP